MCRYIGCRSRSTSCNTKTVYTFLQKFCWKETQCRCDQTFKLLQGIWGRKSRCSSCAEMAAGLASAFASPLPAGMSPISRFHTQPAYWPVLLILFCLIVQREAVPAGGTCHIWHELLDLGDAAWAILKPDLCFHGHYSRSSFSATSLECRGLGIFLKGQCDHIKGRSCSYEKAESVCSVLNSNLFNPVIQLVCRVFYLQGVLESKRGTCEVTGILNFSYLIA